MKVLPVILVVLLVAACVPKPTAVPPSADAGAGETGAAPAAEGRSANTVASLRQQGIKPAVLLAGDLLLLVVALVFVLIDVCRRPRRR